MSKLTLKLTIIAHLMLLGSAVFAGPQKPEDRPGYEKSKDVGAVAPAAADHLFDGTNGSLHSNWEMWPKPAIPISWQMMDDPVDGGKTMMTTGGKKWGTHDLVSKKKYKDFEGHVEFVLMGARGDDSSEGYSNSGVYLQNRYEIQIESPKKPQDKAKPSEWKIGPHGIAAICMQRVPDANCWRPNGTWHAYHFVFKAARWDGDKLREPARVTVWWNGVMVHDDVAINKTLGGIELTPEPAGLKLQEHGQDVRYRNVWIKELREPPQVRVGDVNAGESVNPTRGVALQFDDAGLLFDADKLQAVAAWRSGTMKAIDKPYFGRFWTTLGKARYEVGKAKLRFQLPGSTELVDFADPRTNDVNTGSRFGGYRIGQDSVELRYWLLVGPHRVEVSETLRAESRGEWLGIARSFRFTGLPAGATAVLELPGKTGSLLGSDGQTATNEQAVALRLNGKNTQLLLRRPSKQAPAWTKSKPGIAVQAQANSSAHLNLEYWQGPNVASQQAIARLLATGINMSETVVALERPNEVETPVSTSEPSSPKMTEDSFEPVTLRKLRFVIDKTTHGGAGIDELEVFGPDSDDNLARTATVRTSSVIPGYPIHQTAHLNDGLYGNDHSWVANTERAWIELEWPTPVRANRVAWGRDRTGSGKDRMPVTYRIEVANGGQYRGVFTARNRPVGGPPTKSVAATTSPTPGYRSTTIPPPFEGWKPAGATFSQDGFLYAVAMLNGEVWRTPVPPRDEPTKVSWQLIAEGLNQPIGIHAIGNRIFVAQKPEITELIDENADGLVDYYRTVATGWGLSHGWHEYTFGLAADADDHLWFTLNTGNFWTHMSANFVKPGRFRGSVMRVDLAGTKLEVVATGCRTPNGISAGPDGGIYFTDNQGDWIASCKVARIEAGKFYGHPEKENKGLADGGLPNGLSSVWLPHGQSKSTSGPVFDDTDGAFGPFAGQLFVGDVGYGANPGMMRVTLEEVDGVSQGAAMRFMDKHPLGCQRMNFGPDGQLYVCSLSSGLTRIDFTGKTPMAIKAVRIRPGGTGFVLELTKPLASTLALAPEHLMCRRYYYQYHGKYGSPETGLKVVQASAVDLSADRRQITVTLPVEAHDHGMVYELTLTGIKAEDGQALAGNQAWYTVHKVPADASAANTR